MYFNGGICLPELDLINPARESVCLPRIFSGPTTLTDVSMFSSIHSTLKDSTDIEPIKNVEKNAEKD